MNTAAPERSGIAESCLLQVPTRLQIFCPTPHSRGSHTRSPDPGGANDGAQVDLGQSQPRRRRVVQRFTIPEKLVKPWKLPPRRTYLFKNANVVDPASGKIITIATVRISGGLVDSVSTEASARPYGEADAVVVDLAGKYVTPGLIDAHVHLASVPGSASLDGSFDDGPASHLRQPFVAIQGLRRGFTTLRDCGGATLDLKESIADDVFPGPRLFIANKALSQSGGHGDRRGMHDYSPTSTCCGGRTIGSALSVVCDGVPDCIRAARDQLRTGADFVKIMVGGGVASPADKLANTQFTAAEIRAIVEVAESYGTFVTAHAYTPRAIRHAIDNGVRGSSTATS
jgi:imidazolonepropionase-like amidohydrolase